MDRSIPGFCSISQFVPGLPTGMCGLIATLGALHNKIDPQGYQMDRAGIEKIWQFERANGFCGPIGEQDIGHLYDAVRALYPAGASQVRLVSYGQFNEYTFHSDIKALAGTRAICVEYARGGILYGDEPAVYYHFDSIGAFSDTHPDYGYVGGYGQCDGDWSGNLPNNQATDMVWRPWPNIAAAQPIAYVVCAP